MRDGESRIFIVDYKILSRDEVRGEPLTSVIGVSKRSFRATFRHNLHVFRAERTKNQSDRKRVNY